MSNINPLVFLIISIYLQNVTEAQVNLKGINFKNESVEHLILLDDPTRPSLGYPRFLSVLFICLTLFVGVIVRTVMINTRICMCVPFRVIMFLLGSIVGYLGNQFESFRPIVVACYMDGDFMLLIFLPIIVFTTAYAMDIHSFYKSLPQIVLVAIPGVLLTAVIAAFITLNVIERSLDFTTAMLFGIICAPIYPREVVKSLKETPKGKYLGVLLLGEELIGDVTVMIVFTAIFGYIGLVVTSASQIVLLILRFAGGGVLLGLLAGKITVTLLSFTFNDVTCTVILTISAAYLTYYIGEMFLYVSGLLATIIAGLVIGKSKSEIASDVEQVVTNVWHLLSHATNTLLFTLTGAIIFERVPNIVTVRYISLILVTYAAVFAARLLVYGAMLPMLKRLGYGMKWQFGMACVWGGVRGPFSLCLALIVMDTKGLERIGEIFIIQVTGLVLLSLLINASAIGKILDMLGFAEISLAKKANMTNCVKRIMATRDRCISMLKLDKFLADANWDLVQTATAIKHPYQLSLSHDDDDDDDTYMGYRYTLCPECDREIPNEPTKKEFYEMLREANQRVLKALKISYWRQYEHGKISKEGVRTLVQAVEIAADSEDGRVNLEQLGTLWRPKPYAVWLRKKLVQLVVPRTENIVLPRNHYRRVCFKIASSTWFDIFMYTTTLLNTPVILCEVLLRPPVMYEVDLTIKLLNVIFYVIYFTEMVVKMIGFGVRGYFVSHWNKLDFVILVMATSDITMDILDWIAVWDKYANVNNVMIVTKLLRMLRFLRLCKLARVSVPKVMSSIDHMIDVQLAFGYDVGKGFVTGEQEVCTLLPQLVDNKQIQDMMTSKLEADRLTVTKQLGLLQRDRPWTAITVKTRQATTSTLNVMMLDALQLKEEGFLDEMEFRLLTSAIQEKIQQCHFKGNLVAPPTPETQLRSVSWLQGNPKVADFFLKRCEIRNFNLNDILITNGDEPRGLYILVSGLLEASYIPPEGELDETIPNYEFFTDLKFSEPSQEYIVSGAAVGVLGVLTNRPYSYTVKCEAAIQAYFITMKDFQEAFVLAPHPVMGLEAAMWRDVGIRLAQMILPTVPAYHGWSIEKLSMRLEHAFVPCLKAFKIFVVNELMEDIVLLDGICQDMSTREIFQPPCYIPRTAHRLIFPKSSQLFVSEACPITKLLIIPSKEADELEIMEDEVDDVQCELVSNVSSRCLYHKVVRKISSDSSTPLNKKRDRNNRRRRGAQRRVNYRDSIWSRRSNVKSPSEKELSSKYYKPSNDSVSER